MKKNLFSRTHFIVGGIIIAAIVVAVVFLLRDSAANLQLVTVSRGDIEQEVTVTGRVIAVRRADLGLEKSGRVSWIAVSVGDKVYEGHTLLSIENNDIVAERDQARANVKKEEAALAQLRRGTRPEELKVKESEVESARIAVQDAEKNILDNAVDAFTKSDDAVRNKVDQFFSNPRSLNPQLNFTSVDPQLESDIESGRFQMETLLIEWEKKVRALSLGDDPMGVVRRGKQNTELLRFFLEKIALAINALTPTSSLSQTTIDTYKSSVSTARSNVNTAISNLTAADEKLRKGKGALATAEEELSLSRAGSTPEDIGVEEALLEYALAHVKNIEAQIAKTLIRAPFSGTVIKQEATVGEIVPANSSVITLISEGHFKIDASVPEADIAKIKIGASARVTLDAYGSDTLFPAAVSLVEPGETIIDGVPTYKVSFEFEKSDERIKSGMTANIEIATLSKKGVLLLPRRTVVLKDGKETVTVLRGGMRKSVSVTTGLKASDGTIEIVSGLEEGELVVLPSPSK